MITNDAIIACAIRGESPSVMHVLKEYNGYITSFAQLQAATSGWLIDEDVKSELIRHLIESLPKFNLQGRSERQ